MNSSAAIIIIAHKPVLSYYESISLQQCIKILGKYPIYIVCPKGLDISCYQNISSQVIFDFIPPHWQKDYQSFNRLKILPFLYKRYRVYDYILFYELDAFVFKDELEYWVNKGYDYIGAPWQDGWEKAHEYAPFIGVGNGGFSLRNVKKSLAVLNSFSYIKSPKTLFYNFRNHFFKKRWKLLLRLVLDLSIRNNTFHLLNDFYENEDVFWGKFAKNNFKWFKVPEAKDAIPFSFEIQPKNLFSLNANQLPFGCHGWWKYDFEFWKPFIEREGYNLS